MKDFNKFSLWLVLLLSLLLMPAVIFADNHTGGSFDPCQDLGKQKGICPFGQCQEGSGASARCVIANPAPKQLVNISDFGTLLIRFINWLLYFAGAIAVIFLVIGGYQYVVSHGNEEAVEKAKKTISYAILGIVIIVMAFTIVAIVNNILTTSPPG